MRSLSPLNRVISSPTRAPLRPPNRINWRAVLHLRCGAWFCRCFFIRLIRSSVHTPHSSSDGRALKLAGGNSAGWIPGHHRELNEKTHRCFRIPCVSLDYFCGRVMPHQSLFARDINQKSISHGRRRWHGTERAFSLFLYMLCRRANNKTPSRSPPTDENSVLSNDDTICLPLGLCTN